MTNPQLVGLIIGLAFAVFASIAWYYLGKWIGIFVVLLVCPFAQGQTADITIVEPPMLVLRQGIGRFQAQKEVGPCLIDFRNGKKVLIPFNETIPPTMIDGVFRKYVRSCVSSGTDSFGGQLVLTLPKERVLFGTAQPMWATGTYTLKKKVDNLIPGPFGHGWHWEVEVWDASVFYPASYTTRIGPGRFIASQVTAIGTMSKRK